MTATKTQVELHVQKKASIKPRDTGTVKVVLEGAGILYFETTTPIVW